MAHWCDDVITFELLYVGDVTVILLCEDNDTSIVLFVAFAFTSMLAVRSYKNHRNVVDSDQK